MMMMMYPDDEDDDDDFCEVEFMNLQGFHHQV
jgi:hypothetical protein